MFLGDSPNVYELKPKNPIISSKIRIALNFHIYMKNMYCNIFTVTVFRDASFEAFTAVMIQVEVFQVVTLCSVVVEYQCFRGHCYLHLLPQH